jgi:PAS domain S-box-containing protein
VKLRDLPLNSTTPFAESRQEPEGVSRILANMRGFLYVVSLKEGGLTKYQSPSIKQFVGTDAAENIDNPAYDYPSFIHPDDRAGSDKLFNTAMAAGKGWDIDYRLRRPEGGYRWVREIGTAYRDANGTPETLEGMIIDIDERKLQEIANEQRTSALIDLFRRSHDHARGILAVLGKLRMLGLNARIEAARAGQAGLGFAVVAQELGALSSETITATEAILSASKELSALNTAA